MITPRGSGPIVLLAAALLLGATPEDNPALLDAARRGDVAAVRSALSDGADPNAAEGDGLTALHIAAEQGDSQIARLLIGARANVEAKTRLGEYTPLHLAAEGAHVSVVRVLLEAGADVRAATTNTGVTPLHLAAKALNGEGAVRELLRHGAPVNALEASAGQTPLMFAASYGRAAAVRELLRGGADPAINTEVVDVLRRVAIDRAANERLKEALVKIRQSSPEGTDRELTTAEQHAAIEAQREFLASEGEIAKLLENFHEDDLLTYGPYFIAQSCIEDAYPARGETSSCPAHLKSPITIGRPPRWDVLVGKTAGMTALLHAARDGHIEAAEALLDGGADIDQVSGDGSSPLVLALLNGRFDLAMVLIERGADVNVAAQTDGASPLFAVLQTRWANYTTHPQPRAHERQQTDHLQVLNALLDAGADPNVRLTKHPWYWEYTGERGALGLELAGATPFWRAAIAQDVEAMRMLAAYGADPHIPTLWPEHSIRDYRMQDGRFDDDSGIPRTTGAPNLYPIHVASGGGVLGYNAKTVNRVPHNLLNAVRYLVEEHGIDVNLRDSWGYTPLHMAAAEADNDLVEYLVSKGADVNALTVLGQSPIDLADAGQSGYRVRPAYPETVELLQSFGAEPRCPAVHFASNGDYCPYSGLEPFETAGEAAPPSL